MMPSGFSSLPLLASQCPEITVSGVLPRFHRGLMGEMGWACLIRPIRTQSEVCSLSHEWEEQFFILSSVKACSYVPYTVTIHLSIFLSSDVGNVLFLNGKAQKCQDFSTWQHLLCGPRKGWPPQPW